MSSKSVQSSTPPAIHTPPPKRVTPPSSSPVPPSGPSKMASLLAVFEKQGSQDSRSKSVESASKSASKSAPSNSVSSKPAPAPKQAPSVSKPVSSQSTISKQAPASSKPAPAPSKLSSTQSAPAPSKSTSSASADTCSETGTSSSIKKLLEKFTKLEQDDEPRHGLPRRQSIGGVSVKDLAAKHEKNNPFTKEVPASARKPTQIGRVKPVLMQEISFTTIQEDQELQSDERASEVMKAAVQAGEEKQKNVDDVLGRESFVKLMDTMCDELMNMDDLELEAIANEAVPSVSASQQAPQQIPIPKPIPTPQQTPSKPIPTPQQPASISQPTPTPTSAPELDEEDLGLADLTEDLDFDAIVAEMSRDIAAEESRREEARRSSIQSTGFSLANFRLLENLVLIYRIHTSKRYSYSSGWRTRLFKSFLITRGNYII